MVSTTLSSVTIKQLTKLLVLLLQLRLIVHLATNNIMQLYSPFMIKRYTLGTHWCWVVLTH